MPNVPTVSPHTSIQTVLITPERGDPCSLFTPGLPVALGLHADDLRLGLCVIPQQSDDRSIAVVTRSESGCPLLDLWPINASHIVLAAQRCVYHSAQDAVLHFCHMSLQLDERHRGSLGCGFMSTVHDSDGPVPDAVITRYGPALVLLWHGSSDRAAATVRRAGRLAIRSGSTVRSISAPALDHAVYRADSAELLPSMQLAALADQCLGCDVQIIASPSFAAAG